MVREGKQLHFYHHLCTKIHHTSSKDGRGLFQVPFTFFVLQVLCSITSVCLCLHSCALEFNLLDILCVSRQPVQQKDSTCGVWTVSHLFKPNKGYFFSLIFLFKKPLEKLWPVQNVFLPVDLTCSARVVLHIHHCFLFALILLQTFLMYLILWVERNNLPASLPLSKLSDYQI